MAVSLQNPCVERQRVVIPNRYDEKLVGILHEAGTTDIVIVCHGVQCSKDTDIILNISVALENAQISSFRFDFSGNGESEGLAQHADHWKQVEDLLAVAQHFRESNRNISAIVGHSKGGNILLLYASKYHEIKTIISISVLYDMKAFFEKSLGKDYLERIRKDGFIDVKKRRSESLDFRVTEESVRDCLAINMHDACLQIDKDCSVLTIHGSSDEAIPMKDAFELAKIIPNHRLHVIEGADHFFTNHQEELSSSVVNFIKETLQQVKGIAN